MILSTSSCALQPSYRRFVRALPLNYGQLTMLVFSKTALNSRPSSTDVGLILPVSYVFLSKNIKTFLKQYGNKKREENPG